MPSSIGFPSLLARTFRVPRHLPDGLSALICRTTPSSERDLWWLIERADHCGTEVAEGNWDVLQRLQALDRDLGLFVIGGRWRSPWRPSPRPVGRFSCPLAHDPADEEGGPVAGTVARTEYPRARCPRMTITGLVRGGAARTTNRSGIKFSRYSRPRTTHGAIVALSGCGTSISVMS